MEKITKHLIVDTIEANIATANNRIYSKDTIKKICDLAQPKIEHKKFFLFFGQSKALNAIIATITNCNIIENKICLDIELLDTCLVGLEFLKRGDYSITPTVVGVVDSEKKVEIEDVLDFSLIPHNTLI
jgi:hypothetical protein